MIQKVKDLEMSNFELKEEQEKFIEKENELKENIQKKISLFLNNNKNYKIRIRI